MFSVRDKTSKHIRGSWGTQFRMCTSGGCIRAGNHNKRPNYSDSSDVENNTDLMQSIKCVLRDNESPIVALAINTEADDLLSRLAMGLVLMHRIKTVNFVIHCICQMWLLGMEE